MVLDLEGHLKAGNLYVSETSETQTLIVTLGYVCDTLFFVSTIES